MVPRSSHRSCTGLLGTSHRKPNVPFEGVPNTESNWISIYIFPLNSCLKNIYPMSSNYECHVTSKNGLPTTSK